MPQCPQCGGNQPDEDILADHLARFCKVTRARKAAEAASSVAPLEATVPVSVATVPQNGHTAPQPAAATVQGGALQYTDGIWNPAHDGNYILSTEDAAVIETIVGLSENSPQNLLLTGPAGSGKTSLAKQIAAKYGRPFALINLGQKSEVSQMFGERLFSPEIGTYYQKSLLWQATETDGCVICLDEANRSENPKVNNALQNLLDNNRMTTVDELQVTLRVAPRVIFVLTMNEGLEFSGIDPFDMALRQRCRVLKMGYPPRDTTTDVLVAKAGVSKAQAEKLLNIVAPNSSTGTAMRSLLFAAEFLKQGSTYRQAVFTGFSTMEDRDIERVLRACCDADQVSQYSEKWAKW